MIIRIGLRLLSSTKSIDVVMFHSVMLLAVCFSMTCSRKVVTLSLMRMNH